jgi:galactokinase
MRHTNADAAWWVPGRIEFLGKHTDYAGGRSLLCATERGFCIAGSQRSDGVIAIRDAGSGATVNNRYTDAVQARLTRNFGALAGADISFHSDLPVAAGLSSSSALVVALSVILIELNRLDERPEWLESIPDADTLAEYLSCVENGFSFGKLEGDRGVGTLSGSEDHTAITRSEKGRLIRYSFKPVCASGSVPLPEGHIFVIASSGVQAEKGRRRSTTSWRRSRTTCSTRGISPRLARTRHSAPHSMTNPTRSRACGAFWMRRNSLASSTSTRRAKSSFPRQ